MDTRRLTSPLVSGLIGSSPATIRLRADIARAAPFASNILITGPSGTGKELVAREIHARSSRANRPFVPVDCASLVGELMASQLFGHVAGAFTGANCEALGCFQAANGGTLFLDEIGEMELPLQAKLLRVLQERVVTPVGNFAGIPIDVRVVAATNRNLLHEVRAGRFREDLYYRLHVVHLHTIPLSERREEIPELAGAILQQLASEGLPRCALTAAAAAPLMAYDWPGNVRQLRNVLEQAVIEARTSDLGPEDFIGLLDDGSEGGAGGLHLPCVAIVEPPRDAALNSIVTVAPWTSLAAVEREHLLRTLEHTYFNRAAAARLLGISRQALLRKMERHRISAPESPQL